MSMLVKRHLSERMHNYRWNLCQLYNYYVDSLVFNIVGRSSHVLGNLIRKGGPYHHRLFIHPCTLGRNTSRVRVLPNTRANDMLHLCNSLHFTYFPGIWFLIQHTDAKDSPMKHSHIS